MNVISVVSMKGGVGKTSIAANLATSLAQRQATGNNTLEVCLIDLDSQNACQSHFGFAQTHHRGICHQALDDQPWTDIALRSETGVTCLPYGVADEPTRLAFETLLTSQPDWLRHQISRSAFSPDALVLIDTPSGHCPYLSQVIACADLAIVVLHADGASYATVPAMETYLDEATSTNPALQSIYVLNQVDDSDALSADIQVSLRQHLGERLAAVHIKSDEGVKEAMAVGKSVLHYTPHGQASLDVASLAAALTEALGV